MYIDVKVEVWQRIMLPPSVNTGQAINLAKQGRINDIFETNEDVYYETLVETEEYIQPSENDNQPTVEIYANNGELFWDNTPEKHTMHQSQIKFKENTWFTGRNGLFQASGIEVTKTHDQHLHLIPVTSKGKLAHCDAVIHRENISEFIETIKKIML